MNSTIRRSLVVAVVFGLGLGLGTLFLDSGTATAQRQRAPGFPRYTVIDTEGINLLVTDNQTNTLYFYSIDQEEEVGAELKLRGTVDLNKVGQPTIKPKAAGQAAKNPQQRQDQ